MTGSVEVTHLRYQHAKTLELLQDLEEEVQTLQAQLHAIKEDNLTLAQQCEASGSKLKTSQSQIETLEKQLQLYKEQLSDHSANNEQLVALSALLQQEVTVRNQLEAELAVVRPAVQELQTAIRDQATSFQARIAELEVRVNVHSQGNEEFQRRFMQADQAHKQEIQRLKAQLNTSSDRAKSASQSSRAAIAQLEERLRELTAENTSLQQRLTQSENECTKMRDRLNASQNAANSELRQALDQERSLRDGIAADYRRSQQLNDSLNHRIQELERQLQATLAELHGQDTKFAKYVDAKTENRALHAKLQQLEKNVRRGLMESTSSRADGVRRNSERSRTRILQTTVQAPRQNDSADFPQIISGRTIESARLSSNISNRTFQAPERGTSSPR